MKKTDIRKTLENSFKDFPKKILWAFQLLSITNVLLFLIFLILVSLLGALKESNRLSQETNALLLDCNSIVSQSAADTRNAFKRAFSIGH